MSPQLTITLPLSDTLALIDATALLVIQVLIAQHPELLDAPDEQPAPCCRIVSHAHLLFRAIRELQYAIEVYRACLPKPVLDSDPASDDDFPF